MGCTHANLRFDQAPFGKPVVRLCVQDEIQARWTGVPSPGWHVEGLDIRDYTEP